MNKTFIKLASVFLCMMLLFTSTVPVTVFSGTVQNVVGIENDVPGTVVDNAFGIGSGMGGDVLISVGEEGLEAVPNSLKHGTSYIGGGLLKWGGYYIGAYDTTQDTIKIFTETSKHSTTTGKAIDKGLAVVSAGMGWASVIGGAIAIFTVTATAPATGTLAVVTGTTWAVGSAAVGLTRAVVNTETVRNIEDLMSGKKKLVFAPFERPGIKEGRDIIKEELGFDPYDRSWNEIPDPNTGIPVYKPNIYIYSNRDMAVNVKLSQYERITESIPEYDINNGWDAAICNGSINGSNDYLFYEALIPDEGFQKQTGWVINASEGRNGGGNSLEEDLNRIVDLYKFNETEKKDFLEFWCGMLDSKTSYAVFPQETAIVDKIMPIDISPVPDNTCRIWFYFSPLGSGGETAATAVMPSFTTTDATPGITEPDNIESIRRSDYTAVEWGGLIGAPIAR